DAIERVKQTGLTLHRLSNLHDDGRAEHGVEDTHLIAAVGNRDRFQDRIAASQQLLDRRRVYADIFPIGDVGGGESFSVDIQESKKYFLLTRGLGLDNRATIDRSDAFSGKQGGEPLRLTEQLVVSSFLEHQSDQRVKEQKRHARRKGENSRVPEGETEGERARQPKDFP